MPELSLDGHLLPLSEGDYLINKDRMRFTTCQNCGDLFSKHNTKTKNGWRETQISGYCERCFDNIPSDYNDE